VQIFAIANIPIANKLQIFQVFLLLLRSAHYFHIYFKFLTLAPSCQLMLLLLNEHTTLFKHHFNYCIGHERGSLKLLYSVVLGMEDSKALCVQIASNLALIILKNNHFYGIRTRIL
jgi:hypothetical protein